MQKQRLHHRLASAIGKEAPKEIGTLVDFMRFNLRMNYQQCFDLAHELTGIGSDQWEQLLYEADCSE